MNVSLAGGDSGQTGLNGEASTPFSLPAQIPQRLPQQPCHCPPVGFSTYAYD